ncbi:MAG: hypothetical protein LQ345_005420 [Seirophora villosa]|nr:MAG: hypothetical protein LQ345_005420 [Seirophora villosa]
MVSVFSLQDPNQADILAIRITLRNFRNLLCLTSVTGGHGKVMTAEEKSKPVRVQWDPERSMRMEELPYRSIQIGVSGEMGRKWVEEWIDGIEDVTAMARELKETVDQGQLDGVGQEALVAKGLVPEERPYEVDEELRRILGMDVKADH